MGVKIWESGDAQARQNKEIEEGKLSLRRVAICAKMETTIRKMI